MTIFYFLQAFIQPLNGSIASYFQVVLRNKGWSYSMIGVVTALGQVTTILGPLFVAVAAERRGKEKTALILCTLLSLLFNIPFFLAHSVVLTGICYVVACAFQWSINPVSDGLITKNLIGTKTEYGNIRACGTLGYVVFMFLFSVTGFPSSSSNFQIMLNYDIFSALVLFLILLCPSKSIASETGNRPGKLFNTHWFGRNFYIFIFFVGISRVSMAVLDTMLPNYMIEELGLGRWFTAFIALGAMSEFFCMVVGSRVLKKGKMTPFTMLIFSCIGIFLRLAGYALTKNLVVFGLCQLLHGCAFGFCHIASIRWISDHVNPKHYSIAMAIYYSVALNLPILLGTLAGGFIVDYLGYTKLFVIYCIFSVLGILYGFANRKSLR